MALAETSFVDKCEVVSAASTYCTNNQKVITILIRRADIIEKDGVEIARTYNRHTINAGTVAAGSTALTDTNISSEDAGVQAICNAVWTSSVKEAYRLNLVGIRSSSL